MIRRDAERLVIRTPNHLGELILALPAMGCAARREAEAGRPAPLVQVPAWLIPVLGLADLPIQTVPMANRRAVLRGAWKLRRSSAGAALRAVTLTPSLSSAFTLRLAGVRELRGTKGGGRTLLLSDRVVRAQLSASHRVNAFLVLCGCPAAEPPEPPSFAAAGIERATSAWQDADVATAVRTAAILSGRPVVGMVPGANGTSRRWPVERFGELAGRLGRAGVVVLVFGGRGEKDVTAVVAGRGGDRAIDLGGRTSLEELAGGLRSCDLLVTNDTGPMHLAAALGTPVLALEGPANLRQTRPLGRRVRLLGRFDLPCVPCVKNECPRRGAGYVLTHARRECMHLIEVDEVEAAVNEMLSEEPA